VESLGGDAVKAPRGILRAPTPAEPVSRHSAGSRRGGFAFATTALLRPTARLRWEVEPSHSQNCSLGLEYRPPAAWRTASQAASSSNSGAVSRPGK